MINEKYEIYSFSMELHEPMPATRKNVVFLIPIKNKISASPTKQHLSLFPHNLVLIWTFLPKSIFMKKSLQFSLLIASLFFVHQVHAQKSGKPFSFGLGLEGGAILSDDQFKESFSSELGLSIKFSVKAGPGFVTFSPGALLVVPKSISEEEVKLGSHFPLRLGYKYIFAGKIFVMAEAGYASYTLYTANPNVEEQDVDIIKEKAKGFTYAPSIGVNLGKFEAGIRYDVTRLKEFERNVGLLGARIGVNF